MPIQPVFEKLSAKEKAGEVVRQVKVECKTEVPADAMIRVLNDEMNLSVALGDVVGGKAEFVGKATFFICYTAEEGIKKCECGAEIKDSFLSDLIADGDYIKLSWETDKVETDLSGLKTAVSAYITVKGEVYKTNEYSALTGGDGVYCDLTGVKTVKPCGEFKTVYQAEEDFELGFAVNEVLSHKAEVCLTQVQCGVGTVIADGEIYLTEILLQSGDKKDIIRENRVIPFRAECECEDAMPQLSATCRAFVKSLKTDISVDETKNLSAITALVTVELNGEAYAIAEETFATDAFSAENELSLVKSRVKFSAVGAPAAKFAKISGRANTDDIGNSRIIAVVGEKAEIASCSQSGNGVNVSGTMAFKLWLLAEDGQVESRKSEIPFEIALADISGEAEVLVAIKSATAKLVTLTEIECEADAVFTVYQTDNYSAEIISAVEAGEEKTTPTAAISVYIPHAGEGLWELSKRLNVCPETLVATNSDLQFPLTGKERIIVYRQK
ncbi:MAG: DUF3794 domain-containing protein [Clostridia bacterium]|nr:DUF3794 domain-containing protein [Clostridia bacterium]